MIFLVGNDFVQVDIFHAAENILFDLRILLRQLGNQLFYHHALGNRPLVRVAGGAGVCEMAGALDKLQVVIVAPVLDVRLPDQIHGTYQLHSLEVGAVQFRHHGLHLSAVDHAHEDGLDDIIEVVSQGDLVAAQFLCLIVKVSTAHPGA